MSREHQQCCQASQQSGSTPFPTVTPLKAGTPNTPHQPGQGASPGTYSLRRITARQKISGPRLPRDRSQPRQPLCFSSTSFQCPAGHSQSQYLIMWKLGKSRLGLFVPCNAQDQISFVWGSRQVTFLHILNKLLSLTSCPLSWGPGPPNNR